MEQYEAIDDRAQVDRAFEALKAATPPRFEREFGRMMLMGRRGNVHDFKHSDMRRGFGFDVMSATFHDRSGEGPAITAEEAYEWACS